jgi:hypothetical protein
MRRIILALLVMSAALAGGCAGSGTVYYGGGGTLTATTVAPDLVYVSPGVQVVADHDYPVFYADSYYWRYDGGRWYRSSWYTGGWIYATPPHAVLRIERPYAYRHYRPSGYVSRRAYRDTRPVYRDTRPVYRDTRPVARDHRAARPAPVYRAPAPAPAARDHRATRPAPAYRAPAPAPAPAARDHRTSRPAPRAQPAESSRTRDHRERATVRDHR